MTDNINVELETAEVDEDELKKLIGDLHELHESQDSLICIVPESSADGIDLLNYYSADMRKLAKQHNIPCRVIHGDKYKYIDLKDSDIVLPFLISLSASACYDLLKIFITKFFLHSPDKLKIKMTVKDKKNSLYKNIKISGSTEGVLRALEILENDEKQIKNQA